MQTVASESGAMGDVRDRYENWIAGQNRIGHGEQAHSSINISRVTFPGEVTV